MKAGLDGPARFLYMCMKGDMRCGRGRGGDTESEKEVGICKGEREGVSFERETRRKLSCVSMKSECFQSLQPHTSTAVRPCGPEAE